MHEGKQWAGFNHPANVERLEVVSKPHKHFFKVIIAQPISRKATNIVI
jgi:hypothetical protein